MGAKRWALGIVLACACGDLDEAATSGSGTDSASSSETSSDTRDATGETPTSGASAVATGSSSTTRPDPATSEGVSSGAASSGSDASTSSIEHPPAPVVLVHGFFGFDDFAGTGFVDYFWGVAQALEADGELSVFTPALDPFNNSTVRGEQLLEHVEEILEQTGAQRVNLIGHSQGGLDARVVASLRPDLVESVTTVSTPHGGTPIADMVLALVPPGASAQAVADALIQFFGAGLWGQIGPDTSILESMRQFSEDGILDFDVNYPDAEGVAYYSVAGRSGRHRGGPDCEVANPPAFVQQYENDRDPIDPLFALAEAAIDGPVLDPIPNDGLVRVRDAKRGEFWGCIPADHVDEIGHLFGDAPGLGNPFDHLGFYTDVVAHLRGLGH